MNHPVTPAELDALRALDSCTIANSIETLRVRLRNEGFVNNTVRCVYPSLPPMVGHAVTLRVRSAAPPMGASTYVESTDWWDYVLSVPAPRVVVVQDVDAEPGLGSLLGHVHVNILKALGCVGAVTNGSVRDVAAIEGIGFQLFSGGLSVSHSYVHIIETGAPVQIGGLTISSGDLLHGDRQGVQSIPGGMAGKLPAIAARISERERAIVALCRSPGVTLEKLAAAVAADRS